MVLVVVIGASNHIGISLIHHLIQCGTYDVRTMLTSDELNSLSTLIPSCVDVYFGDVNDIVSLASVMHGDVEIVFHTCGVTAGICRDVNVQGIRNVLETAKKAGVKRLIHTSSIDVFTADDKGVISETNDMVYSSTNASSHKHAKQEVQSIVDYYSKNEGIEIVSLCVGFVYGFIRSDVRICRLEGMNQFMVDLLNYNIIVLPQARFPLVHIDSVVKAHIAGATKGLHGEKYLISDYQISMREFAVAIAAYAGHPLCKVPLSLPTSLIYPISWLVSKISRKEAFESILSAESIEALQQNFTVNNSKTLHEFNIVPRRLEDCVGESVDLLREIGLAPSHE